MTETETETECPNCQAEHAPDAGIIVGVADGREERCCTLCLARELRTETILSDREAEVAAHQQLTDAGIATVAERTGLSRGAVAEHSRQIEQKLEMVDQMRRHSREE
ncbi:MAG: hypothetical protein ABEJ05_02275 [Haloglomus sp.]